MKHSKVSVHVCSVMSKLTLLPGGRIPIAHYEDTESGAGRLVLV